MLKNHPRNIIKSRYDFESNNLKFVDDYNVLDCILLCNKVITINSSVGLLAMMYKKPCGVLGNSFYTIENVNTKINNINDIQLFINNQYTIDYSLVLKYIYFLKFNYLYDAQQIKDKSTNFQTKFISNDLLFFEKEDSILNVNNIIQGSIDWTFEKLLKNMKINKYVNTIGTDNQYKYDLYLKWRNHYFSAYHFANFKKQINNINDSNSSPYDKSISFIHDDLEYFKHVKRTHRTCLKERADFLKHTKGIMLTSIKQMRTLLENNNYRNNIIMFSPLFKLNDFKRVDNTIIKDKLSIGFPFKYYPDNVKNFQILPKILKLLDENYIFNTYSPNPELYNNLLDKNTYKCKINNNLNLNLNNNDNVFLITSLSEGSPLPLYEAIASNKYVISTNVGNTSYIIPDFWLVNDPNNVEEFVNKFELLKNNKYYDNKSIINNYNLLHKPNLNIDFSLINIIIIIIQNVNMSCWILNIENQKFI